MRSLKNIVWAMGVARGWQEGAIASSPCPAEIVGFSNVSEKISIFLVFFVNSMFLFLTVQLELLRFKLPGFELDTALLLVYLIMAIIAPHIALNS